MPKATQRHLARLVMAALLAGAAAGATGCGHRPRPAALRAERTDLALLAGALRRLEPAVQGEVAAARTVWPAVAQGLPAALTPAERRALAVAQRGAAASAVPSYVTSEPGGLTGPAVSVAGLVKGYATLAPRGWRFIAAALAAQAGGAAAAATARFMRANVGLYIYCVYDGHYDLSLVGKTLRDAYRRLGGAAVFGAALTPGEVAALARAYSIPAVRLAPHPPAGLAV